MSETKPWKWLLQTASAAFFFLILSQILPGIGSLSNNVWAKAALLLSGGLFTLVLYVRYASIFEKRPATELRISRALPDLLAGLATGSLFIAIVVGALALAGVYSIASVKPDWTAMVLDFAALSIVAASEETVFRGIVFRRMEGRFGTVAAFIASSLLFGLMHLASVDLWTAIAISAEAGFMLAAAYRLHNSLWLPIGIHWGWNFMLGAVFGVDVSGFSQEYGLIAPEIGGPYLLSGGDNGFEGSIVTCICGILLGLLFLRRQKVTNQSAKLPESAAGF